jgi:predicted PurR-regulated permease PerM
MNETSDTQRVRSLAFFFAVVLVAVLAYRIVQPFLAEIGWAVVLTICLAPVQARLSRRLGETKSAIVLTVLVLLFFIVPLILILQVLVREGAQAVDFTKAHIADRGGPMGLLHTGWEWVHQRVPMLPSEEEIVQSLSDRVGSLASQAASRAGYVLKQGLEFIFGLVITLCILFFMLKDAPDMARGVSRLLPFGRERNEQLLVLVRDIVSASITSTLLIAVIQGIVGGLAFWLLGIPGPFLWACLMAALAILPAVGATLIWAPAAIWLAFSGAWVKGVILALVGILVMGNVDNVVRPLMLSGTARMRTLVLIISLLGGVSAFGFIGIVLGPVVAAVLTALLEIYTQTIDEEAETGPVPDPSASEPAPPS